MKQLLIPEMTRTEPDVLIGRPSFNQVMMGRGIPEASHMSATGFLTTTVMFSVRCVFPLMLAGTTHTQGVGSVKKTTISFDTKESQFVSYHER